MTQRRELSHKGRLLPYEKQAQPAWGSLAGREQGITHWIPSQPPTHLLQAPLLAEPNQKSKGKEVFDIVHAGQPLRVESRV